MIDRKKSIVMILMMICFFFSGCAEIRLEGKTIVSTSHLDFSDILVVQELIDTDDYYKKFDFQVCNIEISLKNNGLGKFHATKQSLCFRDDHNKKMIQVDIDCITDRINNVIDGIYNEYHDQPLYKELDMEKYTCNMEEMLNMAIQENEKNEISEIYIRSSDNDWTITVIGNNKYNNFFFDPVSCELITHTDFLAT